MDPNANLQEQLEIVTEWISLGDADFEDMDSGPGEELQNIVVAHERLCSLVEALNNWIQVGGSLPDVWKKKRTFRFQSNDGYTLIWNRKRQRWTDGDLSFKNGNDNFWPIGSDGEPLLGVLL